MSLACLLAVFAAAEFRDIKIEKRYEPYLRANPLLMEVTGAKVIRLKGGNQVVLGVASAVLADGSAKARLDAEKVCRVKALASVVGEREGVQVAHEEKVEEKTVITIEDGKEKAKSVSQVMTVTKTKVQGLTRGMGVVGRWLSKDGKVLYLAVGAVCDRKGEPLPIDE